MKDKLLLIIGIPFLAIAILGMAYVGVSDHGVYLDDPVVSHTATDAEFIEAKAKGKPWQKNG